MVPSLLMSLMTLPRWTDVRGAALPFGLSVYLTRRLFLSQDINVSVTSLVNDQDIE
jgi:hypothetical protein